MTHAPLEQCPKPFSSTLLPTWPSHHHLQHMFRILVNFVTLRNVRSIFRSTRLFVILLTFAVIVFVMLLFHAFVEVDPAFISTLQDQIRAR